MCIISESLCVEHLHKLCMYLVVTYYMSTWCTVILQASQWHAWTEICSQCVTLLTTKLGGQGPTTSTPTPAPAGIQPNTGQFK